MGINCAFSPKAAKCALPQRILAPSVGRKSSCSVLPLVSSTKYSFFSPWFVVKKTNNISEVLCCTKHNPHSKEPTIPHNYNPVQNSYAALWHEYGEVKSAIALKRVMRHILDYYFLQISGFEGHVLRERIFKDETVFNDADGNRDEELVQSINALLQYVGSDTQGFNAGFDYVEDTEDIQSLKSTFEKVFEIMGQDQHYRMMMETVRS